MARTTGAYAASLAIIGAPPAVVIMAVETKVVVKAVPTQTQGPDRILGRTGECPCAGKAAVRDGTTREAPAHGAADCKPPSNPPPPMPRANLPPPSFRHARHQIRWRASMILLPAVAVLAGKRGSRWDRGGGLRAEPGGQPLRPGPYRSLPAQSVRSRLHPKS
jgi:hypothetical protein